MNPRYRRFLIPGLLVVLIVIVLITSLSREARGATLTREDAGEGYDVVSTMTDPRITESSGLVLSIGHLGLAYTINDSGNDPIIYAIQVSTGKVVGTTRVSGGPLLDTEALSIDSTGRLWIADTGDNDRVRNDVSLYSLPEPGEGDHAATARRYPVTYADGPQNVEALLVNPKTDKKYLVSKERSGGRVYPLPDSLKTGDANTVTPMDSKVPLLVTDGAFTPDGRHAVLRTYVGIHVFDARDWHLIRGDSLPDQKQGETLAMESAGKSILIGSEGRDSQLLRLPFSAEAEAEAPTATTPTATPAPGKASSEAYNDAVVWGIGIAAAVAVAIAVAGALVIRRRG